MIRSLDIRKGERQSDPLLYTAPVKIVAPPAIWLLDVPPKHRTALHIAETTRHGTRERTRRRWRVWHLVAWAALTPSVAALAIIAAWQILRRGL